ncbi:MAG: hypothetical protein ACN6P0_04810 [Pseudomonas capeferrum]|jgi:hypothetical protein|uniref:hypothetical protein n=1 Tax=Pseudomonas TaxID=286 RepID=UPI000512B8C8|nr:MULTISPECIES: hypothetical protein [unclassified Pseudomonas]KGI92050.1 hypothetical protein MD26_17260 [Pseudomonas sp. H2]UDU79886.1 hypothetical protein LJX93_19080 [Pseudomonas sp. HN2-3]UPL07455.1 hypothetical protein PisoF_03154 [Pseudomonas sp. IsoF]
MKRLLLLAMLPLLIAAAPVFAAPAPFYQWQSLVTGRFMCSATNPGEGWMRFSGPYNNAGCRAY